MNCGTKESTIWLCSVTATGDAPGDGVTNVKIAGGVVAAIAAGSGVASINGPPCRRLSSTASCLYGANTWRASTCKASVDATNAAKDRLRPMLKAALVRKDEFKM